MSRRWSTPSPLPWTYFCFPDGCSPTYPLRTTDISHELLLIGRYTLAQNSLLRAVGNAYSPIKAALNVLGKPVGLVFLNAVTFTNYPMALKEPSQGGFR
jgi:hypothetical protein